VSLASRLLPLVAALLLVAPTLLVATPAHADDALADLVERVAPSVVNLHTAGLRQPNSAWDAIFGGPRRWDSLGSGFVVDREQGLVVTNAHVVGDASEILVMDHQGRVLDAQLVGADRGIDLAVVRVPGLDLPAVNLGESWGLRVGEDVFAVGNPYGHGHSVTRGILSARARSLGRDEFDLFLQTDAAINPGNSGGPLFALDGRVVGVNTAIDGRGESLGFAMPVELVIGALPMLMKGDPVVPAFTGLRLEDVRGGGLRVSRVYDGGPAAQAGVAVGDLIVSVDGRPVFGRAGWVESMGMAFPGSDRTLGIDRSGKASKAKLALVERSAWAGRVAGPKKAVDPLYVIVQALAPDDADRLAVSDGVRVVEARRGSVFRRDDILLEINGLAVTSVEAAEAAGNDVLRRRMLDAIVVRSGGKVRISNRW
jgi:serine protease Do